MLDSAAILIKQKQIRISCSQACPKIKRQMNKYGQGFVKERSIQSFHSIPSTIQLVAMPISEPILLRMCSLMSPMTSIMIESGLLELWSPSKVLRCLFLQGHSLNSLVEFLDAISLSELPDMKTTVASGLSLLTASRISKSSTSQLAFLSTSSLNFSNTHGKKQLIMKLGTTVGACYFATCLHKLLKLLKEESATINSASPHSRAVAAPMLLPHRITLKPFFLRNCITVLACSDSLTPKLMVSAYLFLPHPMKSKQARETPLGRCLNSPTAQTLHEELPCMYSMMQLVFLTARQRVTSRFLPSWTTL